MSVVSSNGPRTTDTRPSAFAPSPFRFFPVSWGPNFGESIRLFCPVVCALCSTITESNAIAVGKKPLNLGHFDLLSRIKVSCPLSVVSCNGRRTTDNGPTQFRNPQSEFRIQKMGPHRAVGSWWSAYAITRETWLDRSPRENLPPPVGDASADVDRNCKSQARHFSPRPAHGPHCSDRRREFYNDSWPPWECLTRRRGDAEIGGGGWRL